MARIIGIAGSLRKASFNASLLRAAKEVAPAGLEIEIASIAAANGLLLVTPEYNNGIPGVFKNAIDWLSRPPKDLARVFGDKPVAIMGATPGMGGTRFAQTAWLPVLRTLGTRTWAGKQLYVAGAGKVFDGEGKLTDDKVKQLLTDFVAGFGAFVG